MNPESLQLGFIWYVVFLFSTVCHEASHAFAAHRLGDSTAEARGQVSLNPWPHIRREPIGMVLMPLISFAAGGWMIGWASTPYSMDWALAHPRRKAAMSLAGPLANCGLVLVAGLLIQAGISSGVFWRPSRSALTTSCQGCGGGAF